MTFVMALACSAPTETTGSGATSAPQSWRIPCVDNGDSNAVCSNELVFGGASIGMLDNVHTRNTNRAIGRDYRSESRMAGRSTIVVEYDPASETFSLRSFDEDDDADGDDGEVVMSLGPQDELTGEHTIYVTVVDDQSGDRVGSDPLICPNLDAYFDDLLEPARPTSSHDCGGDGAFADDQAGKRFGCTECAAVTDWLDSKTVYRRMKQDADPFDSGRFDDTRLTRAHILVEEMAQWEDAYLDETDGERAEFIGFIVTIASVFRFAFDIGDFHGEFGSVPSGTWTAGPVGQR